MPDLKRIMTTVFLLLLYPATGVFASHHEGEHKTDYTPLPAVQNFQGTPYVSGGVGSGEREDLREELEGFNLKLIFALTSGAYLAGIPVKIKDQQGKMVLDVKSEGPWLYVSLPAGSYTIIASRDQNMKEKAVTLEAKKRQDVRFLW